MSKIEYSATLEQHPGIDGTYIRFPYDTVEIFGTKVQVKVKAWIDGVLYRGSLVNMGMGCHIIGITQAIRKQIGKKAGDTIQIIIEKDTEERTITPPADLCKAFEQNVQAAEYFHTLSFTNRKEYVNWIEGAKRSETRTQRLAVTIEKLIGKKKNPFEK
jgi:hypothetical protein